MTDHQSQPLSSRHVAVIGAGASGLMTAHELRREGHRVAVFERGDQVGGTWAYTPRVESDPLGLDPSRSLVHSSVYESLRTNLPRELMSFRDFPFVAREDDELRDHRRFPSHREVLKYLRDFAKEFGIEELARFETEVVSVSLVDHHRTQTQWRVVSKKRGDLFDEIFDAVVVCNGHHSEPRVAEIPGIDAWPGKQIHSHNYRTPQPFRDQVVVLIGISASALDISRDISGVVREAHIAARSISDKQLLEKIPGSDNIWIHPMIKSVHEDGSVIFQDESVVFADTILHCTGYKYNYPFLETNGIVTVDDNRVGPLYKHVFPPALAPWLSFVGLPLKSLPFPLYELQSKWISGVLSNRIELPSEEEMTEDVTAFYAELELSKVPKRYTHDLCRRPFEYEDWLVGQCGCPAYEERQKEMLIRLLKKYVAKSATYRDDDSGDEDLVLTAKKDVQKHFPNEVR